MAKIEVSTVAENEAAAIEIQKEVHQAESAVRERAHDLAQNGLPSGNPDLENWLQAERQLYWVPSCELLEEGDRFRLRAAVPGLEARQVRLTALPGTIVLKAGNAVKNANGQLHFSEFNRNTLLRRIDLPSPIDTASVKAKLERGVLELVASKQAAAGQAKNGRKTKTK